MNSDCHLGSQGKMARHLAFLGVLLIGLSACDRKPSSVALFTPATNWNSALKSELARTSTLASAYFGPTLEAVWKDGVNHRIYLDPPDYSGLLGGGAWDMAIFSDDGQLVELNSISVGIIDGIPHELVSVSPIRIAVKTPDGSVLKTPVGRSFSGTADYLEYLRQRHRTSVAVARKQLQRLIAKGETNMVRALSLWLERNTTEEKSP